MAKYTVLVLVPDYVSGQYGEDTWNWLGFANTKDEATAAAQQDAFDFYYPNEGEEEGAPTDWAPLFVTLGHHENLAEGHQTLGVETDTRLNLISAEAALGDNLQWIADQVDLSVRQKCPETLRRLAQLDAAWKSLVLELAP